MKPWSLVHRGRVEASAVLLDPEHLGEAACRRRVLDAWEPGCRLERVDGRLLLRFPGTRVVDGLSAGLPFVAREGALVSAPLRDAEQPSGVGLFEVRGGELQAVSAVAEDPADWLAVDLPVAVVHPVGVPPRRTVAALPPEPVRREGFGVPPPAAELEAVVDLLRHDRLPPRDVPPVPPTPSGGGGWLGRALGGWFGGAPSASDRPVSIEPVALPPTGEPGEPGLLGGLAALLQRWFGAGEGMAPTDVPSRQGRILTELLGRFDGDLEEALRYAIPLGGTGGLGRGSPALRLPPPRDLLSPALFGGGGGGGSFSAPSDMYDALRQAYLRAVEALEAQGEVEKAAFVHADLLGDTSAAVDLLEKHGRYTLAARLAETRLRDWSRAVRLHLLAGDIRRGLQLTHTHGVFAQALLSMPDAGSKHALRAAFAAHLVQCGRLDAAVGVVWEDPALRAAAVPWLERIVDRGGPGAMDALVKFATVDPARADAAFDALLASRHPEDVAARTALARHFVHGGAQRWGRRLARALLRDAGEPGWEPEPLVGLVRHPYLADLRADLPVLPQPVAGVGFPVRLMLEDTGTTPITDAVWLPHGVLCALGEVGSVLLGRSGEVRWRDPTPVTHWVPDDEGFVAIGVHRVGDALFRLSRVDLRASEVQPWARVRMTAFAPTCREGRWLVVDEVRPFVMDLAGTGWTWLHCGEPLRAPCRLAATTSSGHALLMGGASPEMLEWTPSLGSITRRRPVEPAGTAVLDGGTVLAATGSERHVVWLTSDGREKVFEGARDDGPVVALALAGLSVAIAREAPEGVRVTVYDLSGGVRGTVDLLGAVEVGLRVQGSRLGCFDDRGRVVWVELPSGVVLRQHRV
ncbi:MAG: bpX6 domain-containing protein [Myxococcota bacterium]